MPLVIIASKNDHIVSDIGITISFTLNSFFSYRLLMMYLRLIVKFFLFSTFINFHVAQVNAKQSNTKGYAKNHFEQCLFSAIKNANKNTTLAQLDSYCETKIAKEVLKQAPGVKSSKIRLGALAQRLIKERRTAFDPYVITPHKMNYIMPFLITDKINTSPYKAYSDWAENIENTEAKFQLSIKVPLTGEELFVAGDQIFFGFTLESWWQVYSQNISKPFRETNYQPEFFYFTPIGFHPFSGNSALIIGFEHQSNGRSQVLSRSWNRVYFNYLYEKNNFALSLRPWWRIPEQQKTESLSDKGDDNPDIGKYMGNFELIMVYKFNQGYEFAIKTRENFAKHHGFVELGVTFPLWGKLKGYAKLSSGYGESLIDYDHKQHRFGIGIVLTDLL